MHYYNEFDPFAAEWLRNLMAAEDGWLSLDDTYSGYSVEDGVLWAYESDVCGIAKDLGLMGGN